MPRPLALIVLLFLPERHVEAIQSLAACSIKLEGRLPADCTVPAYDYTALCSTTSTTTVPGSPQWSSCCTTSPVPFPPAGTVSKAAPTSLSELIERTEAIVAEIVNTAVPEVSDLCDSARAVRAVGWRARTTWGTPCVTMASAISRAAQTLPLPHHRLSWSLPLGTRHTSLGVC